MKLFKRVKDIVNSNISAKLDKLEDPQKMIRYMLGEMQQTLTKAKSSLAERIANKTIIEQELAKTKELTQRWEKRATLAVEKERDDLAREALSEKGKSLKRQLNLEEELIHMQSIVDTTRQQIRALQEKIEEIRNKERILVQRAYHAKEKKEIVKALKAFDTTGMANSFNELETKIERMEAEAELAGLTSKALAKEKEFSQMENSLEIEAELAQLKAKKKPQPKKE